MQFEMFDADLIAFPLRRYARLTRFTADQLCGTKFEKGEKIWSEVVQLMAGKLESLGLSPDEIRREIVQFRTEVQHRIYQIEAGEIAKSNVAKRSTEQSCTVVSLSSRRKPSRNRKDRLNGETGSQTKKSGSASSVPVPQTAQGCEPSSDERIKS